MLSVYVIEFSDTPLDLMSVNLQMRHVIKVLALTDGEAIITNETEGKIQIVHLDSKAQTKRHLHTSKIKALKHLINFNNFLFILDDHTVTEYDLLNVDKPFKLYDKYIKNAEGNREFVYFDSCVMIRFKEIVAANSEKGEIFMWDIEKKRKHDLVSGLKTPFVLACERKLEMLAVSVADGCRVILYDNCMKKLKQELSYSAGPNPPSATFTPNGKLLVADYSKNKIIMFCINCEKIRHIVRKDDDITYPVSTSYCDSFLWVACLDGKNVKRFTINKSEKI